MLGWKGLTAGCGAGDGCDGRTRTQRGPVVQTAGWRPCGRSRTFRGRLLESHREVLAERGELRGVLNELHRVLGD